MLHYRTGEMLQSPLTGLVPDVHTSLWWLIYVLTVYRDRDGDRDIEFISPSASYLAICFIILRQFATLVISDAIRMEHEE